MGKKMVMSQVLLEKFNQIETRHWWWTGRRKLVVDLIGHKPPLKLLDIGCGTGETLTFLKTVYPHTILYGVDPLSTAVSYSRRRNHFRVIRASASKLPFPDSVFDVVLFLDVLEHISDDSQAIREAKRVLRPGGKIIITAPALKFIWSGHDTGQGHIRRYTRHEMLNLAQKNHLGVGFVGYFNFFLSLPIIIIRSLSRIQLFSRFSDYDNGINYDIAKIGFLNNLLSLIFCMEIALLKYIRYPLGISVAAQFVKSGSLK